MFSLVGFLYFPRWTQARQMNELPHIITDLGMILGAAAVTTFVFRKLKQPIVLGYLIAGLIVGPHFHLFPTITDNESVEVWAQIGVIILLFNLGLEFSFKKLVKVGGPAAIAAFTEVIVMLVVGYGIGVAFGWSRVDSIFLGGIMCISSTTIIIRAFDELGLKGKNFVSLVFGILVIQDLVAIVMLVLLPAVAVSMKLSGMSLLFPIAKLTFFLVLWFVSGIFFLPTVLRRMGKIMSDEMLLITALALCFLMVMLATRVGFSPALGAFIMGSILAETRVGGKIEHLTKPVKDLFGAVFFISVGMMIDLDVLPGYWRPILLISLAVMILQPLGAIAGALLSGQPLKTSVQAGMSLSQIGEFSFIIATLGLSLGVTGSFLYPIAVAVSGITTFTTPYMVRLSGPIYKWLERTLPARTLQMIQRHSTSAQAIKMASDWKIFIRSYLLQIVVYSVIIFSIIQVIIRYVAPIWQNNSNGYINIIITVLTLILLSPFLWALTIRSIKPAATARLWSNNVYKGPLLVLQAVRGLLGLVLVGILINSLLSFLMATTVLCGALLLMAFSYKRLQMIYEKIESRFFSNFHDRELQEQKRNGEHLAPWDAHITSFTLTPDFNGIGRTLLELKFREQFGVNIAMIRRGDFTIQVPDRRERIYPGDNLYVIGTDEQVDAFKKYLDANSSVKINYKSPEQEVSLQQVMIGTGWALHERTIKESQIRERTKGLIVGIERGDERILNPESNVKLLNGDKLWIVGNNKRIRLLVKRGMFNDNTPTP